MQNRYRYWETSSKLQGEASLGSDDASSTSLEKDHLARECGVRRNQAVEVHARGDGRPASVGPVPAHLVWSGRVAPIRNRADERSGRVVHGEHYIRPAREIE